MPRAEHFTRKDKEVPWESPHTICCSVVNPEPREAVTIDSFYAFDDGTKEGAFHGAKVFNKRATDMGATTTEWALGHYRDMFTDL